jgi:hypothetical protein
MFPLFEAMGSELESLFVEAVQFVQAERTS